MGSPASSARAARPCRSPWSRTPPRRPSPTSANPSRTGQPVTFTATVIAGGMPVTSGAVKFTRGKQLLGTAALDANGTARLTVSSLPKGSVNIQALFEGTIDDFPSTSPAVPQRIDKFTTATGLTFATQLQPNGQMRDILEADVIAIGGAGISPVGQVVFRRNGRTIGRARLNNGSDLADPRPTYPGARQIRRGASGRLRVQHQPLRAAEIRDEGSSPFAIDSPPGESRSFKIRCDQDSDSGRARSSGRPPVQCIPYLVRMTNSCRLDRGGRSDAGNHAGVPHPARSFFPSRPTS